MNLTKKLLTIDAKKYTTLEEKEIEVPLLSEELGEPFMVKIRQVTDKRMAEIQAELLDDEGKLNFSKSRDVYAMIVTEGLVEPSMGDNELQEHFRALNPYDLAEKLFKGSSLQMLADEIGKLGEGKKIDVKK